MWKHLFLFSLLCCSALCALDSRWKLLWSDEFTGTQLDNTKWSARNMVGNLDHEYEYYLPEYVSVSGGLLHIKTDLNYKNTTTTQAITQPYLSGWLDSVGKFASTYGRYEMYAKVPVGIGWWPAFWMLSEDLCWPIGSEFDILEYRGYQNYTAWGTYHFASTCGVDLHNGSSGVSTQDLSKGYHTYALEWFPGNATWYLDDKSYTILINTSLYNGAPWNMDTSPHFFILNTAIGTFSIPSGGVVSNSTFPQEFLVDYVRAYSWDPCTSGCIHGCCDPVTSTCKCDAGYKGSNCEYTSAPLDATGKYVADFTKGTFKNNATVVNGVLTLTATLSGCPNGTGLCVVPSWQAPGTYDKGNLTFTIKNTNVKGFAFGFTGLRSAANYYEGLQANWIAGNQFKWSSSYYTGNSDGRSVYVNNSFDGSKDFHTYSIIWALNSLTIYVDGVYQNTVPASPNSPQYITFTLTGNSNAYGQINASVMPTSAYVKYFSWTPLGGKAVCAAQTTSTTASTSTHTASTATVAGSTTAKASTATTTTATGSTTSSKVSTTTTTATAATSTTKASTSISATSKAVPSSLDNSSEHLLPALSIALISALLLFI